MIYKSKGIGGDVIVKLPCCYVRIGVLNYRLMHGSDKGDPIASFTSSSTDPNSVFRGYVQMQFDDDQVTLIKSKTLKKWGIEIPKDIQHDLIELCFRNKE